MRKICMQVFAFMIMAVSQLLFLEVAHADTIYTISFLRITNTGNRDVGIDIAIGEGQTLRRGIVAGRNIILATNGSLINIQNPYLTLSQVYTQSYPLPQTLSTIMFRDRRLDEGFHSFEISRNWQSEWGAQPPITLLIEYTMHSFESVAPPVPNSRPIRHPNGTRPDVIALPNGSPNWSTCSTVGSNFCPKRYLSENQGMRTICDTNAEFLAHRGVCFKIWTEFDAYNSKKASNLPAIVYTCPPFAASLSFKGCAK